MNREILFRGKDKENNKWFEGFYSNGGIRSATTNKILYTIHFISGHQVIPETVGQYTGLTDENGKKIFEGDVVKITDTIVGYVRLAVIEFGNPNGQYNWGWQLKPISKEPFAVDILHWVDMEETGAFIEVIGNVYDNPELLKGEKE